MPLVIAVDELSAKPPFSSIVREPVGSGFSEAPIDSLEGMPYERAPTHQPVHLLPRSHDLPVFSFEGKSKVKLTFQNVREDLSAGFGVPGAGRRR